MDEEDPVKRLVFLGVIGLAAGIYFTSPEKPAPESGVEPANSPPLTQRVSRAIRNPSRAPAAASAPARTLTGGIAEAQATRACYASGDCAYPDNDPHEYAFAVGRDLADKLRSLREAYGNEPGTRGELETLAREMMGVDDGYVQAEALRTLSLYPPSEENLRAMVSGLHNTYDPLVVKQAMAEWKRYVGTPEEPLVVDALAQLVARGGQFTGEAASADLDSFLNHRTAPAFRAALAEMVPTSTAAINLRRALAQFELRVAGG